MNIKPRKIRDVISFILTASIILSCFALFSSGAAASVSDGSGYANITVYVDFENETITLSGKDGGGPVKYMYSPNATASAVATKLATEKWYPIYGDTISITPYIPRTENGKILFAFRDADEFPRSDGTYSSRVLSIPIPGRPYISAVDFKNNVKYDPESETIKISGDLLPVYDYQIGNNGEGKWITGNSDSSIEVRSKYNPMGGTAVIRKSAAADSSFASNEYKIRIPAAPAIPKVKVNETTKKIIGIMTGATGYWWSISENGEYTAFANRTVDLTDFENQMGASLSNFTEESNTPSLDSANTLSGTDDYIIIYIKIPATDKRPSSPVQKLYVKKSLIENSKKQ